MCVIFYVGIGVCTVDGSCGTAVEVRDGVGIEVNFDIFAEVRVILLSLL